MSATKGVLQDAFLSLYFIRYLADYLLPKHLFIRD